MFSSAASNLVAGDTNGLIDTFLYDRSTSTTARVSVSATGAQASGTTPSISADGLSIVFESFSANLVSGDTNGKVDIFASNWQGAPADFGTAYPFAFGVRSDGAYTPDPVDLGTGSLTIHTDDLVMPGRVLILAFTRWYNSADKTSGPLGMGWSHSYNWSLTDQGTNVTVRRGDGRQDVFTRNADGLYSDPPGVFDVLTKNADATFSIALTNQVAYEFSASGQLLRIHEPAGNQILLTYTGESLTSITDTAGRSVSLTYDGAGHLAQIQDPLGRRTSYSYDATARLIGVIDRIGNAPGQDPTAHRWQYTYDGNSSRIASAIDPVGRTRATNFYWRGRVVEQRDPAGGATRMDYAAGQTTVTDPRGHATTYAFDGRFRITSRSDIVGGTLLTESYTYDAAGDRTSITDRTGGRTDLTYDARGNVLTKTDPAVDALTPRYVTQFAYDAKNNLTQVTDPLSFVTTLAYDPATNVLLSVSRQADATTNAVTKYEYTDPTNPGLPTRVIAPRGNAGPAPNYTYSTTLTYDAQGNLASRVDPDGAKTNYAYDGVGRLTSFVDPDGFDPGVNPTDHTWTIGYDDNDRVVTRTDPLGSVLRYAYDASGAVTSLTDRLGNITTYAYDANARLASVTQRPFPVDHPLVNYVTSVVRDANGNATRIVQGSGVATDYSFDELDRLVAISTHPDGATTLTTRYALDGTGQPVSRTTADGVTATYGRDGMRRLTSVNASGVNISFSYDGLGRRTQMVDGTGTTTYQYDGLGRLTQTGSPAGAVAYQYDLDGNRTGLGYPGAGTVIYAYTPGGRLANVTDWANRLSTYGYRSSGLVSTVTYPDTMQAEYLYDRAQRLTGVMNTLGSTTLSAHLYGLDAEGDRTSLDEFVSGITPVGPSCAGLNTSGCDHTAYSYDGLTRLAAAAGTQPETFTFDGASNVTSRTGPVAAYSYDGANRLTSDGVRGFTWSQADRLIQRGTDSFAYDALARMTSSTVAGAARSYGYDGDGLVRSRTDGPTTTTFLWDASRAPAPLMAAGGDRVVYGLGPLYIARSDGTTLALARDGLGSVRAEVNDAGIVTRSFRYAAYGEIGTASPSVATPTVLGYAGELRDPSGLIYLRARWHDPGTGRLLQRDPFPGVASAPSSLNGFGYAQGNPVLLIDPTGLATGGICLTASFSAGGFGLYQVCPVIVDSAGNVGWSATIGAGLSPSLAVSATGGLQASNAPRITDLQGPFTDAGGSAGALLVGGSDWFWNEDASVQGGSAQVGFGVRATGLAPFEIHAVTTNTKTGVFFNVFDVLRNVLRLGSGKRACSC